MKHPSASWAVFVLLASFMSGAAWSQDQTVSREREALRRAQQQMQQLRSEKAGLEVKLKEYEQEKEKLEGQARRAKSESAKNLQLQQALDSKTQENQALQEQKSELEARLVKLADLQALTERNLAKAQAESRQALSTLSNRDQQVTSCEEKNVLLYEHGRALIEQCRDRSASAAILRLEPFTGVRRVAMENLLEEYRDKLDAQKLSPGESRK